MKTEKKIREELKRLATALLSGRLDGYAETEIVEKLERWRDSLNLVLSRAAPHLDNSRTRKYTEQRNEIIRALALYHGRHTRYNMPDPQM